MSSQSTVYDELGVPTVINCAGEQTRISGTLMRPEAADAMRRAANAYVHLGDLQSRAGELITEATGAEAGYVTNGAASALTLGTAACIADNDYEVMNTLPRTDDVPDEVVIPCAHRNEYEVAYRVAGARLVSAGMNDLGNGLESVEPWEVAAAITDSTAAVTYVDRPHNQLSLQSVIDVAHERDVPVIVDAAAELPPTENLRRYIDVGADLVAFSGGKAVRGPQTTGILAGRAELVQSVALQHLPSGTHEDLWDPPRSLIDPDSVPGMPRHGIGRPMKVGKEELVGLIRALELFLEEDESEVLREWNERASFLMKKLREIDGLVVSVCNEDEPDTVTVLHVGLESTEELDIETLIRRLRAENPRIFVGEQTLNQGVFRIVPKTLTTDEARHVVDRIRAHVIDFEG
ncbi:aminotransferase class V-fold PLP-dependent enzyme [Halorarum salinum]|uniref:Aminotransferase class V-fold PLP-dependent enzyme n=1 Tax=Halorarum salinum TaxID=2743089 RepID=A0A7D5L9D3_9EURY|nr:aminotransferase class V-fold PLP-dependent enzyme [Halobaculum salinum]QLG61050.1 aminotransferase class V-fold PLP-dependent enzyme [Halobaculum salinum]